jgi:hypothetical protein
MLCLFTAFTALTWFSIFLFRKTHMTTYSTTHFSRRIALGMAGATLALGLAGCASMNEPAQAVMLLEPANGATVSSPFKVRFGIKGMTVAEAGEILANSGHHHLLINQAPIAKGESVPFSDQHLHFGKGQTETDVKLAPGTYKLTAQFANGAHQSYGDSMSRTITVTVK